jgi:hypothetical protein
MIPNNTSRIIVEKDGYRRERLPDNIHILRLTNASPETIDAWFEDCQKLIQVWRIDRSLRYLHDVREAEQVTPHATEKVVRILRQMRYMPVSDGRGAILVKSAPLANLLSTFFKRRPYANWSIAFFSDEDEALAWLRR